VNANEGLGSVAEPWYTGQRGADWTHFEIEATVAAYDEMLLKERNGQPYAKTEVVRSLMQLMPARSRGAVELKLQNVSAVRMDLGLQWIDGYKPMPHYQRALREVVTSRVRAESRISESLADYGEAAIVAPYPTPRATSDVLVPPPGVTGRSRRERSAVGLTGSPLDALHDLQRRRLGTAGEEWVVGLEREQLARAGRPDLADLVRWVAREEGDGLGYDVQSFRPTGAPRLIEVKTTNYGSLTPFHITRWEVDVSRQQPDAYSLYRVHGFTRDPRIYVLDGAMDEAARLEPSVFLGLPAQATVSAAP
jgi:hypothetical protein